jgi:hypothetical protein
VAKRRALLAIQLDSSRSIYELLLLKKSGTGAYTRGGRRGPAPARRLSR